MRLLLLSLDFHAYNLLVRVIYQFKDNKMRKIIRMALFGALFVSYIPLVSAADDNKIAIVNVNELFNKSSFVQKANKDLQNNVKKMETQLQAEKDKLQKMLNDYEASAQKNKKDLAKKIADQQTNISTLSQQYQQKVQEQQNSGLQTFTRIVQVAVQKVAKEKHFNTVLNSNSILYSDNTWTDITKEVEAAMQQ